jgi:molecular chaperone DnaK (HSP70)
MVAHSWTKLLLDRGTPLTQFDDALEEVAGMGIFKQPPGKSAIQVVADYLSKVYNHILQAIAKQITEATLQITPLEFWFTVPAIWSDEAKHATLQAAHIAGFGTRPGNVEDKINLITEPEAAAIAALRKTTTDGMGPSVKVSSPFKILVFSNISLTLTMQAGDGVLVCDCGGGTVVSYPVC